jgi:hypothetical protein
VVGLEKTDSGTVFPGEMKRQRGRHGQAKERRRTLELDLLGVVDMDAKPLFGLVLDIYEKVLVIVAERVASLADEVESDLESSRAFVDAGDIVA